MVLIERLPHAGGFLISEANGDRSREQVTVASGADVYAGSVLMNADVTATAVAAHVAGGTGNSTFSAVVVGVGAVEGVYGIVFTAATKFDVEDPSGVKVGSGTTGVEFDKGGLTFTITAGGTAHVAGDAATITVDITADTVTLYDGTSDPVGVLYADGLAADAAVTGTAIVRDAEVKAADLTWDESLSDAEIEQATIVLREKYGIIAR